MKHGGMGVIIWLFFSSLAVAQLPRAAQFTVSERIWELVDESEAKKSGPNYPQLMDGWHIDTGIPLVGSLCDTDLMRALQTALVASMRNYSKTKVGFLRPNELAAASAEDTGKALLNSFFWGPLNRRLLPQNMRIGFDQWHTGVRGYLEVNF